MRCIEAVGVDIEWEKVIAGEEAIEKYGNPLPDGVLDSIKKNKVAAPYGEATFELNYFTGINKVAEVLNLAVEKNIIERPNNVTYKFGDNSWRGRDATIKAIESDKKLLEKLTKLVGGSEEETNGKKA